MQLKGFLSRLTKGVIQVNPISGPGPIPFPFPMRLIKSRCLCEIDYFLDIEAMAYYKTFIHSLNQVTTSEDEKLKPTVA